MCFLPSPEECGPDFLSRELLQAIAPQVGTYSAEQRVIPSIHFTCNGALTGWMIGASARRRASADNNPSLELQIWRCGLPQRPSEVQNGIGNFSTTSNRCRMKNSTVVTNSNLRGTRNPNVYVVQQNPHIQFQRGDILGIFQPAGSPVELYYHQGVGPYNTRETNQTSALNNLQIRNDTQDFPLVRVRESGKLMHQFTPICE